MVSRDKQSDSHSAHEPISRRRMLTVSGAAALTIGVAGCMDGNGNGDGNNSGNGGGSGGGGSPREPTFDTFTNAEPLNSHFNPYNPAQGAGMRSILYNQLWVYNGRTNKWHPRLGKKFSLEGKTATVEMDPSYKWADGKSVTATDLVKQLQIDNYLGQPIWDYIDSMKKTSKTSVEFTLTDTYNESIFRNFLNRNDGVFVKRGSEWEQWLDRFDDASGNKEKVSKVENDLRTWSYAADSGDPVTNGPYVVGDRSSSKFVLTPNKHFPYETNIPKYVYNAVTADQQIWRMATTGKIDGTAHFGATKSVIDKLPDTLDRYDMPIIGCYTPVLNLNHGVWGKREARQALAYLIDHELLDQNVNPRFSPIHQTTGLPDRDAKALLSDSHRKQMSQYGVKSQPKQAAERMRAAGLQKQNGKWRTADGAPITFEFMGANWPVIQGATQTLQQQLPQFGIEYTGTIVSASEWSARRSKGQFDMTHGSMSVGTAPPTPWLYYNGAINNRILNKQAGHPKKTVKLPPVGKPNGPLQTVNLQKLLQNMATTDDQGKLKQLTTQGAWYINQYLPRIPVLNGVLTATVATDTWTFPSVDADIMGLEGAYVQLLKEPQDDSKKAILQAKTE